MANIIELIIKAQDLASDKLQKVNKASSDLGDALAPVKRGMEVAAIAIGAAGVASVKMAADYEQSLNIFQSVSGATAAQMALVSEKARQLGKDAALPGISAADAAAAMTELAKAGLSVNDTLAASKGVLSLAKAGNLAVADAATIAAQALNAFGLSGDKAGQVADVLSAAANASASDVADLALGLQQSAAVANQFGVSLNDTATTLALFANRGMRGSDAGTSLKTMLIALANPSQQASDAMAQIGLKAYDATGKFVGMRQLAINLQDSLKGLTEEQKQQALATIFGTDAFRAASFLATSAGQAYDNMSQAVGRNGAAADLAKAQNSGFKGALDNLISTAETAGTDIGTKLLPPLTAFIKAISNSSVFDQVVKNIDSIMLALGVLGATFAAFKIAMFITNIMKAAEEMKVAAETTSLFNAALITNPIVFIVTAVIALIAILVALQIKFNIFGKIFDWIKSVGGAAFQWIGDVAGQVADWVTAKWNAFIGFMSGVWNGVKAAASTAWNAIWNTIIKPVVDTITAGVNTAAKIIGAAWNAIKPFVMPVVDAFKQAGSAIVKAFQSITGVFAPIIDSFKASKKAFDDSFGKIGEAMAPVKKAFDDTFGAIKKAWDDVVKALSPTIDQLKTAFTTAWDNIKKALAPLIDLWKQASKALNEFWNKYGKQVMEGLKVLGAIILGVLLAPLALLVAAILALAFAFAYVIKWVAQFIGMVAQLVGWLIGVAQPYMAGFATAIGAAFQAIIGVISAVIATIIGIFMGLITIVSGVFTGIVQIVGGIISGVFTIISSIFTAIVQWFSGWFQIVIGIFTGNWDLIKQGIGTVLGSIWTLISGVFTGIWQTISGILNGIWSVISGVWNGIWHMIGAILSGIWSTIVSIWNGIWGAISGIVNGIRGTLGNLWNGLVGGLQGAANSIAGIFGGIGSSITGGIRGAINWVIDAINGMINKVNSVTDKVPGAPHIGNIGRLASGTPSFAGGLTMVGERGPEIAALPAGTRVMSATETRQAMNGGGGRTTYNIDKVELGTAEAVREFFSINANDNELAQRGLTPRRGY